jgi:ribosome-associated protein
MKKSFPLAKLSASLVKVLDALKFTNILVCDTQKNSVMFDQVIIATCTSSRQAHAAIRDMHKAKLPVQNIEGQRAEEWILADCGAVIVHMMLPKVREYFRLEELWQNPTLSNDSGRMPEEHPRAPIRKTKVAKSLLAEDSAIESQPILKKRTEKSSIKSNIKTSANITKTPASSPRAPRKAMAKSTKKPALTVTEKNASVQPDDPTPKKTPTRKTVIAKTGDIKPSSAKSNAIVKKVESKSTARPKAKSSVKKITHSEMDSDSPIKAKSARTTKALASTKNPSL